MIYCGRVTSSLGNFIELQVMAQSPFVLCLGNFVLENCNCEMAPTSATPEQIDALLSFLDEHRDLARGRLRSIEGKVQAKRLWEELCNTLNSMGGCIKTIQQWQKVWFDRKHLAKKAAADSRRSASGTGGGPSTVPPLSHWELKVLAIMGDGFGDRGSTARVLAFSENEPQPSTSREEASLLPSRSPELQLSTEPTQLSQPASPPPVSQASNSSRRRRRQSAAGSTDVRSRLFQIEMERAEGEAVRNTELAGIKDALIQLRGLAREYLDRL